MIAGRLNEIIAIEELKIIKNEYGEEQTDNYVYKFKTRAEVNYNGGNRMVDNNELFFSNDITFTIRYYHNINELDRIKWNKNYYRILAIERNRQLQLINLKCVLINE